MTGQPVRTKSLEAQAKLRGPAARAPATATAKNRQQGEAAHRPAGTKHENATAAPPPSLSISQVISTPRSVVAGFPS